MVRSRPVTTVAAWAVSGLTNREIAERLHISVRTVAGHPYRILNKIVVTSRAQLPAALTPGSGRADILIRSRHQGIPRTSLTPKTQSRSSYSTCSVRARWSR
ncbi:response regulator transcription factor [Streptomyces mirabilis]